MAHTRAKPARRGGIPLMSCRVAAGFPSAADDFMEDEIDLNAWLIARPAATFIMRVGGHSMKDAGILDGDYVVVDHSITPRPGHIVVAAVHGDLTIKYLHRHNDGLWLSPANRRFPEIPFSEASPVEIWGVVTGSVRRMTTG